MIKSSVPPNSAIVTSLFYFVAAWPRYHDFGFVFRVLNRRDNLSTVISPDLRT